MVRSVTLSGLLQRARREPFAPEIALPAAALAFLLLGWAATIIFPEFSISALGVSVYIIGVGCFAGGVALSKRAEILESRWLNFLSYGLILVVASAYLYRFEPHLIFAGPVCVLLLRMYIRNRQCIDWAFLLGGLAFLAASLWTQGIPLFNPGLKAGGHTAAVVLADALFVLGFVSLVARSGKAEIALYTLLGMLFMLGGYRGIVVVILLSLVVVLHNRRMIGAREVAVGLAAVLAFVMLFAVVRGDSGMGAAGLFLNRAGYTYDKYEYIVNTFSPVGHAKGRLWEASPYFYVGELTTGFRRNTTPGMFGFLWLDGGILEVIAAMALIGILYGNLYRRDKTFYALGISYLLIAVETGFNVIYLIILLAICAILSERV
ncbi:MAG: hypothetical protein ABH829_03890 [archaeon]